MRHNLQRFVGIESLPMGTLALVDIVRDEERPVEARRRALRILERVPRDHRRAVAQQLAPALSSSVEVAGAVHLALLVLESGLAVGRDVEGRFIAAEHLLHDCDNDGVFSHDERAGRVVGLDDLARLFGPDEDLPAFLALPDRPAPPAYRPSPEVLEVRRLEQRFHDEQRLMREKLAALGLDPDDLDDDLVHRPTWVERHRAPIVASLGGEARVEVRAGAVLEVGKAHAGDWWADERAGDHRGARRWHLRLHRAAPTGLAVVRRERPLRMRDAVIEVALGDVVVAKEVDGRGVVVFIEEEDGLVVAVTLTWSSWEPFRPREKSDKPDKIGSAGRQPRNGSGLPG